jgi:regulator of sigma E protease
MWILTNTLAFVAVLGIIVFIHELGHLLVARACKMGVLVFSLGFGPRLFGVVRGGTDYRISAIPLGGYVRLAGEDPAEARTDPNSFHAHPRWQRILVYLGGPAANAVLAFALFTGVLTVGMDLPLLQQVPPIVGAVEEGSPAALAGFVPGDVVLTLANRPIRGWQDIALEISQAPGRSLAVTVDRDGSTERLAVTPVATGKYELGEIGLYPRVLPRVAEVVEGSPAEAAGLAEGDELRAVDGHPISGPNDFVARVSPRAGESVAIEIVRDGSPRTIAVVPELREGRGIIGVRMTLARRYPLPQAMAESVRYCVGTVEQIFEMLSRLVSRQVDPKHALHGAIEIAAVSGEAARQGPSVLIHLIGLVSISIGLLNLFPIPMLDGGQITVLLVESVLRRDLPLRAKEGINMVGAVLLLTLTVTVLYFDLERNVSWLRDQPAAEAESP